MKCPENGATWMGVYPKEDCALVEDEGQKRNHSLSLESGQGRARQTNINVRAALIHVIGDFVQSVGIFIAALIIYFRVSANCGV